MLNIRRRMQWKTRLHKKGRDILYIVVQKKKTARAHGVIAYVVNVTQQRESSSSRRRDWQEETTRPRQKSAQQKSEVRLHSRWSPVLHHNRFWFLWYHILYESAVPEEWLRNCWNVFLGRSDVKCFRTVPRMPCASWWHVLPWTPTSKDSSGMRMVQRCYRNRSAIIDGISFRRRTALSTSHKGHSTSHKGHITSHKGHSTSHKGHITSHKGHGTSHKGHSTSHKGHSTSHKGYSTSYKGYSTSHPAWCLRKNRRCRT